jgi:hypothetical protein
MLTMWQPLSVKVDTNFADKQRSLGQYNSLADSGHRVYYRDLFLCNIGFCNTFTVNMKFTGLLHTMKEQLHQFIW